MGETLPYMFWRLDSRYALTQTNRKLKMPPSSYLKSNFSITTSGQFSDVPLACAISALGEDNVMFSIDYPYADSKRRGTIHRKSSCLGGSASEAVQRQRRETLATIAVIHALKLRQQLRHDSKLTL